MNKILNFGTIYHFKQLYKSKDKLDMILEPLQCMIQLSLLSVCPIGTKLTIQENILNLQIPNIVQPIYRWYNSDKKDDLFFIFQVLKRFIKWYNPKFSKNSPLSNELYDLIINMSIEGLIKLQKTYNSSDSTIVSQVIYMYKKILETNDIIDDKNDDEHINMDEVFENITKIYSKNILDVIYSTLILIKNEDDLSNIYGYIEGFNLILSKVNRSIKDWIKTNLMI